MSPIVVRGGYSKRRLAVQEVARITSNTNNLVGNDDDDDESSNSDDDDDECSKCDDDDDGNEINLPLNVGH